MNKRINRRDFVHLGILSCFSSSLFKKPKKENPFYVEFYCRPKCQMEVQELKQRVQVAFKEKEIGYLQKKFFRTGHLLNTKHFNIKDTLYWLYVFREKQSYALWQQEFQRIKPIKTEKEQSLQISSGRSLASYSILGSQLIQESYFNDLDC